MREKRGRTWVSKIRSVICLFVYMSQVTFISSLSLFLSLTCFSLSLSISSLASSITISCYAHTLESRVGERMNELRFVFVSNTFHFFSLSLFLSLILSFLSLSLFFLFLSFSSICNCWQIYECCS